MPSMGARQDSASREEFTALTAFRGFAALLVVVFHYSGSFLPNLVFTDYTEFFEKGYLWVDFFFLLSGFVISHAYGRKFVEGVRWEGFKQFAFARLARIYPLHAFVLLGFLLLELVRVPLYDAGYLHTQPFTKDMSPYLLGLNFAMLQTTALADRLSWNGPAWSIGAEWVVYLVFPLLAVTLMRRGWRRFLVPLAVAAAGLVLISQGGRDLDVTYDFGLLRCLFEFLGGVMLYRLFTTGRMTVLRRDWVPLVILALLLGAMHLGLPDLLAPLLMAVLILALAANTGRVGRALSWRPFTWLGQISYSVYLSHMLVLQIVLTVSRVLLEHRLGRFLDPLQSVLALLVFLGGIVALSALLYRHVDCRVDRRFSAAASRGATSMAAAPRSAILHSDREVALSKGWPD